MEIQKAAYEDLAGILALQKLAYQSEAELLNDYSIQPLAQTLTELQNDFENSLVLKLTDEENNIIGSVRAREENGRVHIYKLIVHPDYQNKGLGARLLKTIETFYEHKTYELFTSSKSERNLYLYNKMGYKEYKREHVTEGYGFVFLEK